MTRHDQEQTKSCSSESRGKTDLCETVVCSGTQGSPFHWGMWTGSPRWRLRKPRSRKSRMDLRRRIFDGMFLFNWSHVIIQYWSQCVFVIPKWHRGLPMTGRHSEPPRDRYSWMMLQATKRSPRRLRALSCLSHVSRMNLLSSIDSTVHQGQTWQIWYCLTQHSPPLATVGPKGIEGLDNSSGFWFLNECNNSLEVICRTLAGSW